MFTRGVYWRRVWADTMTALEADHLRHAHNEVDLQVFAERMKALRGKRFVRFPTPDGARIKGDR